MTLSNPVDRILAQRIQHAVAVTRNQENVDCQPEQQAPHLTPQTDQGNHRQDRQSSQHSRHQLHRDPHSRSSVRISVASWFTCSLNESTSVTQT